jgi:hypothetical protein
MEDICKQSLTTDFCDSDFTEEELTQFSRQLILKNWSLEHQKSLTNLRIYLATPLPSALLYLVGAGCRKITCCKQFATLEPMLTHARLLYPATEITVLNEDSITSRPDVIINLSNSEPKPAETQLLLESVLAGVTVKAFKIVKGVDEQTLIELDFKSQASQETGVVACLAIFNLILKTSIN